MKLANKVIIITGASKGLGVSMAEECAREGARVVMAARSQKELDALAEKIRSNGGEAEAVVTDMSRPDAIENLVRQAVARFGQIDGLVNNAGVNYVKPFLEVDLKEWQRVLDVDLTGSFLLTQLCARQMKSQGGGGPGRGPRGVLSFHQPAGASAPDRAFSGNH